MKNSDNVQRMAPAAMNRSSGAARSTRFGDFSSAPSRHNSDERHTQTTTLGLTNGRVDTSWQPSGAIWGNNAIGNGLANVKRDAARAQGSDDIENPPSGSAALATSSEADPWVARQAGPWNPPDTTSPTFRSSHSGSTSPSHVRNIIPTPSSQTLLDIHNHQPQSLPAIGQGGSFSISQSKSNLDPSSGSFYARRSSFVGGLSEDKENSSQGNYYDTDIPRMLKKDQAGSQNISYYTPAGSASGEGSLPPSRASDSALNVGVLPFGNENHHASHSSMHLQRPSTSALSGSYNSHMNGSRYVDQSELELRERFAKFGLRDHAEIASMPQGNDGGVNYSSSQASYAHGHQSNGGSPMWNDISNTQRASSNYESFANQQPFADQAYFNKPGRFDRISISPAGSDYRHGLNSPKSYPRTPPIEAGYRPGSRGVQPPRGPGDLDRRLSNAQYAQQQNYYQHYQTHYQSGPYEYAPPNFRPGTNPYNYLPGLPYPPARGVPTRPAKDQDVGVGVRSLLLEEFRSNSKANRRYDLKDIYNHVVEFSGDQHGSRFIQQKLETANSDEKEQLFREIQPNALQLMTDVFGNYVIQKLFEHGNQVQKRVLAEQMKNHVMELSMQMYGCRVVQKALEHVLADQQAELAQELQADVLKCVKDQNGNHVVQKAIERVPTEHIQFVIDAFRGQVATLAVHPYGCRVIQRILEYCKPQDQFVILEELHRCAADLITDQYGNYVTQHLISHGKPEDRNKIISIVSGQLLTMSKHKFASNVVEKSIQYGSDEQRKAIVAQLTAIHSDGSSPCLLMMKDQYGNYVIQKLLGQLKGVEREMFVEDLRPHLISLKKYNYGKQIAAIEKLICTGQLSGVSSQVDSATTQSTSNEVDSTAPTPMLTHGQNSPRSSSIPSTNASTTEESSDGTSSGKTIVEVQEKGCPEVVLHSVSTIRA